MLDGKALQLDEQEIQDNYYAFFGVPIVYTRAFGNTFGDICEDLIRLSLMKLKEKYPKGNYDYLQVCHYQGETFWIISDASQKEKWKDEHVTFLLPSDY